MHTEEELPIETPAKSADSATASGRILCTCPAVLYDPRPFPSPGAFSVDEPKADVPVTPPEPAAETPPVPETPPAPQVPSVPEPPSVPETPVLAPEPVRRAPTTTLPVRGNRRGVLVAIALAGACCVAAIPLWPQSDDEPRSSRPAAAPSSPAHTEATAPAPAPKDATTPRAPVPPAATAKDVRIADKSAATPPAPAPAVKKPAFRPRLPQPEIVGAARDVGGLEGISADSSAAQRFDLSGLAAHEDTDGAKEIRRLVAGFREGDLAAEAEIQRKLAQFYTRFDDAVRAQAARDRAIAIERAIAAAAPVRAAEKQLPPAGSAPGVPAPGFGGGQPAGRTPTPAPR